MYGGIKRQPGEWDYAPETPPPVTKRLKAVDPGLEGNTAEVRYGTHEEAATALALDGTQIAGLIISVEEDTSSWDGTKVLVHNVAPDVTQAELKNHFESCGNVVFAGPRREPGKGGGAKGAAGATKAVGEVRFDTPEVASAAVAVLHGSFMGNDQINATIDKSSRDGSRAIITGLPLDVHWQDLKDYCMQAGSVAYCSVKLAGGPGFAPPGHCARGPCQSPYEVQLEESLEGEVRYDSWENAETAMRQLNGSSLGGVQVWVRLDTASKDGTRLFVSGVPPYVQWQELKDHFAQVGRVAFADVRHPGGKGKGYALTGAQRAAKGAYVNAALAANYPGKGAKGKGFGGGGKTLGDGSGEVRFSEPSDAQQAVAILDGSLLQGAKITVTFHEGSHDLSKLVVTGLPPTCQWQELKDHFAQVGRVAFANIVGPGEVRMETAEEAQRAQAMLDGSEHFGKPISVEVDSRSKDGSRLVVRNLPASTSWQTLKDLFASCGTVAFAAMGGKR